MSDRHTIPPVGDNFRRLPAEDEARILREWKHTQEDLERRAFIRNYPNPTERR